jgi:hypothetical protein
VRIRHDAALVNWSSGGIRLGKILSWLRATIGVRATRLCVGGSAEASRRGTAAVKNFANKRCAEKAKQPADNEAGLATIAAVRSG